MIDASADAARRTAIRRIVYNEDTDELKTHFAIYNSLCATVLEPIFAEIEFETDMEARTARIRVAGLIESDAAPIVNPVTGAAHRAQIVLPGGFEFAVCEVGSGTTVTELPIPMRIVEGHAQFNVLHINQDGVIR